MDDPFRIPDLAPRSRPIVDPRTPQAARLPGGGEDGSSFKDVLAGAVTEVQQLQNQADTEIKRLVSGEVKDVTQAMVAIERADVSFQTMMAVRNKIVAAYEEVMRMQV